MAIDLFLRPKLKPIKFWIMRRDKESYHFADFVTCTKSKCDSFMEQTSKRFFYFSLGWVSSGQAFVTKSFLFFRATYKKPKNWKNKSKSMVHPNKETFIIFCSFFLWCFFTSHLLLPLFPIHLSFAGPLLAKCPRNIKVNFLKRFKQTGNTHRKLYRTLWNKLILKTIVFIFHFLECLPRWHFPQLCNQSLLLYGTVAFFSK